MFKAPGLGPAPFNTFTPPVSVSDSAPGAAEQMKPTRFSCHNNSRQKQVTLCVAMATPPGEHADHMWRHVCFTFIGRRSDTQRK